MSEPRVIKKYPNRRLYDTVESRYITLADVRKLVVERIDFVVVDKKSQEDITRCILLQVIAELEQAGDSAKAAVEADPGVSRATRDSVLEAHLAICVAKGKLDLYPHAPKTEGVSTRSGPRRRGWD